MSQQVVSQWLTTLQTKLHCKSSLTCLLYYCIYCIYDEPTSYCDRWRNLVHELEVDWLVRTDLSPYLVSSSVRWRCWHQNHSSSLTESGKSSLLASRWVCWLTTFDFAIKRMCLKTRQCSSSSSGGIRQMLYWLPVIHISQIGPNNGWNGLTGSKHNENVWSIKYLHVWASPSAQAHFAPLC